MRRFAKISMIMFTVMLSLTFVFENDLNKIRAEEYTYSIKYNLYGGENHPDNPSGYNVDSPTFIIQNPTKEGYSFVGWYKDSKFKTKQKTTITTGSKGNLVYYAKYKANTYTVVFNANTATGTMKKQTITYGKYTALNTITFKKTGYSFIGWNSEPDGSGTNYSNKHKVINLTATDKGIVNLYAQWELTNYTITYKNVPQDVSIAASNPLTYTYLDDEIILNNPEITGKTFLGWYKDSKFKKKASNIIPDGSTGNKTFYAKFSTNKYSVVFNANSGTGKMKSLSVTYGKSTALTANAFKRSGYRFIGWNSEPDGSGTAYTNKQKVLNLTSENKGVINLYAQWELVTYTVTYKNITEEEIGRYEYPESYTVLDSFSLLEPSRKGYEFLGWYKDSKYKNKASSTVALGSTGNKVFYAKWKEVSVEFFEGTDTLLRTRKFAEYKGYYYFMGPDPIKDSKDSNYNWGIAQGAGGYIYKVKKETGATPTRITKTAYSTKYNSWVGYSDPVIYGDYLYCKLHYAQNANFVTGNKTSLYRINLVSGEQKEIKLTYNKANLPPENLCISNKYIYFSVLSGGDFYNKKYPAGTYRAKLDGTGVTRISEYALLDMKVSGNADDGYRLYGFVTISSYKRCLVSFDTKMQDSILLAELKYQNNYEVYGDTVYYEAMENTNSEDGKLMACDLDGSNARELMNYTSRSNFAVNGDWVYVTYFTNYITSNSPYQGTYRIKTDGSHLEKICNETPSSRFIELNGRIVYLLRDDSQEHYCEFKMLDYNGTGFAWTEGSLGNTSTVTYPTMPTDVSTHIPYYEERDASLEYNKGIVLVTNKETMEHIVFDEGIGDNEYSKLIVTTDRSRICKFSCDKNSNRLDIESTNDSSIELFIPSNLDNNYAYMADWVLGDTDNLYPYYEGDDKNGYLIYFKNPYKSSTPARYLAVVNSELITTTTKSQATRIYPYYERVVYQESTCSHTYGEWIDIKAATQYSTGRHYHICTKCNHLEYATIPYLTGNVNSPDTSIEDRGTMTLSGLKEIRTYGDYVLVNHVLQDNYYTSGWIYDQDGNVYFSGGSTNLVGYFDQDSFVMYERENEIGGGLVKLLKDTNNPRDGKDNVHSASFPIIVNMATGKTYRVITTDEYQPVHVYAAAPNGLARVQRNNSNKDLFYFINSIGEIVIDEQNYNFCSDFVCQDDDYYFYTRGIKNALDNSYRVITKRDETGEAIKSINVYKETGTNSFYTNVATYQGEKVIVLHVFGSGSNNKTIIYDLDLNKVKTISGYTESDFQWLTYDQSTKVSSVTLPYKMTSTHVTISPVSNSGVVLAEAGRYGGEGEPIQLKAPTNLKNFKSSLTLEIKQYFAFEDLGNGKFHILDMGSRRMLASSDNELVTGIFSETENEVFTIQENIDGTISIIDYQGKYLTINGGSSAVGTSLVFTTGDDSTSQKFNINKVTLANSTITITK